MAMQEDEKEITRESNPVFFKLFDLKNMRTHKLLNPKLESKKNWYDYEIRVTLKKDINSDYSKGTIVRIWMVSRFDDVGITKNLENPIGYDMRGIDADYDLEIINL